MDKVFKFDAYDGDLLVISSDSYKYRCHLDFLCERSEYFKNNKDQIKSNSYSINYTGTSKIIKLFH